MNIRAFVDGINGRFLLCTADVDQSEMSTNVYRFTYAGVDKK